MAKKYGLREVYVHFGTFDFAMLCVVGPYNGVPKYISWKYDGVAVEDSKCAPRGRAFFYKNYVPIVWIPRRPRKSQEYATLAHEIMHVVVFMLVEWAGITLTKQNDEVFCHALGYAMRTILDTLDR